jgi:hypothetical protein
MDEVLTIAQIEAQFKSEWILVEDPLTNEVREVQSGKVRWHSKDREEVYRQAIKLRPQRFAILYTGRMSEDTVLMNCLFDPQQGLISFPCKSNGW